MFSRDPYIESRAFDYGLTVEQIKRIRLSDLYTRFPVTIQSNDKIHDAESDLKSVNFEMKKPTAIKESKPTKENICIKQEPVIKESTDIKENIVVEKSIGIGENITTEYSPTPCGIDEHIPYDSAIYEGRINDTNSVGVGEKSIKKILYDISNTQEAVVKYRKHISDCKQDYDNFRVIDSRREYLLQEDLDDDESALNVIQQTYADQKKVQFLDKLFEIREVIDNTIIKKTCIADVLVDGRNNESVYMSNMREKILGLKALLQELDDTIHIYNNGETEKK